MAKTLSKSSGGALAPWLGISLIVILFDQLTKIAVLKTFAYGAMHALTPFFNLTLIYNAAPRSAFSRRRAAGSAGRSPRSASARRS